MILEHCVHVAEEATSGGGSIPLLVGLFSFAIIMALVLCVVAPAPPNSGGPG